MGMGVPGQNMKILDIDTPIFHNTFGDFPKNPDIHASHSQTRFYLACLGWLGRNPFLNWYLKETGKLSYQNFKVRKEKERENLVIGSKKLATFLGNKKFAGLPDAFDAAYEQLDEMKKDFYKTYSAWTEIKDRLLQKGESSYEDIVN